MLTKTEPSSFVLRVASGLQPFVNYQRDWLRADLSAGITLAAYLLPAGIGDASLAGLPPEAGLYACMFSGLVFWLFCSSRQTAITVTSAISLLIGTSLGRAVCRSAAGRRSRQPLEAASAESEGP